jgi:hypothetical protein
VKKRWVYAFTDALPPDAEASALLGGKGAGLAELTRAGFAVPPRLVAYLVLVLVITPVLKRSWRIR